LIRKIESFKKSSNRAEGPSRAAAYVRMSTDLQKYSTENQLETIRRYAAQRDFIIVRTFEDSGRSGLTISNRDGLQSLMQEVESGAADFQAILVYDVSRWGRFQDADEGAYHEHVCSRAGIRVHYCGEQFDNDGSIGSILLKNVKRVMAGEYSRELSVKVFAGQCRLIEHGFRQGGPAGFGLRRLLVDEGRHPKGELARGDRKSLQTDRVVLVPGPPEEIEHVQSIYSMFVEESKSEREIALALNERGILSDLGRPWTRASIHQILTNEKYIGNNIFNRVSYKLKQHRVINRPETWVRADGVFPSIVDRALFERARAIIDQRGNNYSDEELLSFLQTILQEEGALSGLIIDEREGMPSSSMYRSRFGSLLRAYSLIGYTPERDYRFVEINRHLRESFPGLLAEIIAGLENAGGYVACDPTTQLLSINGEFTASVVMARSFETSAGALRWKIQFDTGLIPDVTIAVRLNRSNERPLDYYLLPSIDMNASRIRMAEDNALSLDAYRFESLNFFYSMAAQTSFSEAA
jgi:DNA invertase Pin-like site-specific DNA recombinase